MALEANLAELELKHRMLEREIETELAHPSDALRLAELKKRKLRVKDEMVRLRGKQSLH